MKTHSFSIAVLLVNLAILSPVTARAAGDVLWDTEVTTTPVNAANYGSPPTDNFTQDGVAFTLNYLFPDHPDPAVYGGSSIPTNNYFVTTANTVGSEAGVLGFGMNTDEGAAGGEGECVRVRFNFSPAIGGLAFPLLDIDNSSWRDMVLVRATYQGNPASGAGTIVDVSPTVQQNTPGGVSTYTCADIQTDFGNGLCFVGITANATNAQTRGNVDFDFPGLVDQLEVSYCESDNADHGSQLMAFGDFAWDYNLDEGFDFGDALGYSDAWHQTPRSTEFETISISNADDVLWTTVNLENSYTSPVVACTYTLPSISDTEAVVRIRNAGATSFEVRIQHPDNSASVANSATVQCLVAEEGQHTLPDNRVFEAHTVLSTGTSGLAVAGSWGVANTENVSGSITGSYTNPVVLGQVMTFNDTDFSAFWSFDCNNRQDPPFTTVGNICVGKNIGEVNATRANETLGYIVIEAGSGSFADVAYEAALGADTIAGVGSAPPYSYGLGQTYDIAVATQEAMDGGQGGWAVLFGANPLAASQIDLAIDEETLAGDTSRGHTDEQVGYWALTTSEQPYIGATRGDPELGSQNNAAADGDDTDGNDDEDGVSFRSPGGTNNSIFADVEVNNPASTPVTLCGWMDIAGGVVSGSFDATDAADSPAGGCYSVAPGISTLTFQWSGLPAISATTYARFRVSSDALSNASSAGVASDGEVEDYRVIFDFTPTAVTIGQVTLEATRANDFLARLNISEMDRDTLLNLLTTWSSEQSASLQDADRATLIEALQAYLDPDGDGQVAVFFWETLEERGTIGFYVDRSEDGQDWSRINQALLPGMITAPMGAEYMLADPLAQPGKIYQYQLTELEARGTLRHYGPFTLELK